MTECAHCGHIILFPTVLIRDLGYDEEALCSSECLTSYVTWIRSDYPDTNVEFTIDAGSTWASARSI